MIKKKYIGESKLSENPDKAFRFKIRNQSIMFSHLSLDALEGIKAWLEGHPPVPVTGVFDSTFDATFA